METLVIILASLGVASVSARLVRRGPFALADLTAGLLGALAGMSMADFIRDAGGIGLPLIFACGLTLGLGSLRRRAFLHEIGDL